MKLAIAGKGGTGKTTLSGTIIRELARRGHRVTAIDADPNPTLAMTMGIDAETADEAEVLPRDLLVQVVDDDGRRGYRLRIPVSEIVRRCGLHGPDGTTLIIAGRVEHAARGCNCGTHAAVRAILGAILEDPGDMVFVDMEAGVEHLSRAGGTLAYADALLVVLEPFYKSLVTGRSVATLAAELGIPRRYAVANKVRTDGDLEDIAAFCKEVGLELIGRVPWDTRLHDAERLNQAPIDFDPETPAVVAARKLAVALLERAVSSPAA